MTILQQLHLSRLVRGVGDYAEGTACLVSAAVALWRFRHGAPLGVATSELDCICPVIRSFCITINDAPFWENDQQRTKVLGEYVHQILNTKASEEIEIRRAFLCADFAIRKFAPLGLRASGLNQEAAELETLPPIIDKGTAAAAAHTARDAAAAYAASGTARDAAAAYAFAATRNLSSTIYAAYAANAASAVYGTKETNVVLLIQQLLNTMIACKGEANL